MSQGQKIDNVELEAIGEFNVLRITIKVLKLNHAE